MSRAPRPSRRQAAGPAFPGPLLMLFPILLLVGAIAYLSGRSAEPGAIPAPPVEEGSIQVGAWLGQGGGAVGEQLFVRLVPLHGEAERQAFDAESLARRLELDTSGGAQPWRLELRYLGESAEAPDLELSDLAVLDELGEALRPLPSPESPGVGEVADPLLVLLAPPPLLRRGEVARLVLWGRAPSGEATLTGCLGGIALHPDTIEADDPEAALASLGESTENLAPDPHEGQGADSPPGEER